VELHQITRADGSSDDDDNRGQEENDVHRVFLPDRKAQASCDGPGQEDGVGVADNRQDASGKNAPTFRSWSLS
jgi:hypothetical protein